MQKCVHLVDLIKSFHMSIQYLPAKIGFDTAEIGPLKVCQTLARSYNFRINIVIGPQQRVDSRVVDGAVLMILGAAGVVGRHQQTLNASFPAVSKPK